MKTLKQIFCMINESTSGRILPLQKFWFKSGGGFVPMESHESDFHHIYKPATQPEKFGITIKTLENMKPLKPIGFLKKGLLSWDENIISGMNDLGHFRGIYSYTPVTTTNNNVFPATHHFTLADDRNMNARMQNNETLVEKSKLTDLRQYEDHLHHILKSVPKNDDVNVELEFPTINLDPDIKEKLQKKYGAHISSHRIKFIGKDSLGSYVSDIQAKKQRDPIENIRNISSTEIRQALGRNRPEGMTAWQWNNIRTFGDSYTPIMIIRKLINEMSIRKKSKYLREK